MHPVLFVEYDRAYCGQVDTEPVCARAYNKRNWHVAALLETDHLYAAFQWASQAVDAAQRPALVLLVRPALS
jgi:hypothetical protein